MRISTLACTAFVIVLSTPAFGVTASGPPTTLSTEFQELAQLRTATRVNTLLDRPPDAPIDPVGEPQERVLLPAFDELQRMALDNQPELRSAQLRVERAEATLAVVNREYKPDFFVGGGYLLMPRDRDAWMANLGITWPNAPWARGKLDGRNAEASAEVEAARAQRRTMENRVRLAVQEAYVRVKAAEHGRRCSVPRSSRSPSRRSRCRVRRTRRIGSISSH